MNLSLENPYGEVTIPRAKLRPAEDPSTVIANPLALNTAQYTSHSARNSNLNPYGNFNPSGEDSSAAGLESQGRSAQSPPAYQDKMTSYTIKEDEEEVGRCNFCCRRCRRK